MTDLATDQACSRRPISTAFRWCSTSTRSTGTSPMGLGEPGRAVEHVQPRPGAGRPGDTFVTINNDTVYSMAQIDLGVGPVALHVPGHRWSVLRAAVRRRMDQQFAYVGHRATGNGEGDFLFVPPGLERRTRPQATVIRFPTTVASIVGRWAVAATTTCPLCMPCRTPQLSRPLTRSSTPVGLGLARSGRAGGAGVLGKAPCLVAAVPARGHATKPLHAGLAAVGHRRCRVRRPYPSLSVEAAPRWCPGSAGAKACAAEGAGLRCTVPQVNGWKLTFHAFDYNLDFFEVGALDDDQFKIEDPKLRIVERAAAASAACGATTPTRRRTS